MSFADSITPADTEEIKPGFFVQKRLKGYKQVYPFAWNGKIRYKEQLSSLFSMRTIITIAIIIFIAWSYQHDVDSYKTFYEDVQNDPTTYCLDHQTQYVNPDGVADLDNSEVIYEGSNIVP